MITHYKKNPATGQQFNVLSFWYGGTGRHTWNFLGSTASWKYAPFTSLYSYLKLNTQYKKVLGPMALTKWDE